MDELHVAQKIDDQEKQCSTKESREVAQEECRKGWRTRRLVAQDIEEGPAGAKTKKLIGDLVAWY